MRHSIELLLPAFLAATLSLPVLGQSPGEVIDFVKITSGAAGGPPLRDSDQFGRGADILGDLDGDGVQDLAVGALGDDDGGVATQDNYGAVWILLMQADGRVKGTRKIGNLTPGFTGVLDPGDEFGRIVAAGGDLNGDGIPDLVVGATKDDDGGSQRGAAYLLFLNRDGTLQGYRKISHRTGGFVGQLGNGHEFGRAMRVIPDLDGNGYDDLVVGAIRDSGGGYQRGAIYVLFLGADGLVIGEQRISSDEGGFSQTLTDRGEFGFDIGCLGDLDGDGNVEIVVAAPDQKTDGNQIGALFVLFLRSDGTVKRDLRITEGYSGFTGDLDYNDEFGACMRDIGDVDGDGMVDLAVGVGKDDDGPDGATDRGAVFVLFMNPDGTVRAHQKISMLAGRFDARLRNGDRFGTSIAAPGDVNGDGVPDLYVGARFDDEGGPNTGAMYFLALNDGTIVPPEDAASVTPYGCGVNPEGSLTVVDGHPRIGQGVSFGIDNPLGTQTPGAATALLVALRPDPAFPCGRLLAGYGMAGAGSEGELLISQPFLFRLNGPAWVGPGEPSAVRLELPANEALIGRKLYVQGVITGPAGSTVTGAFELVLGL